MARTNYYIDIWQPMTRDHYERGGWYSINGQRLTLADALEFREHFDADMKWVGVEIHFKTDGAVFRGARQRNMIKSYPPSLWAHGGKRATC